MHGLHYCPLASVMIQVQGVCLTCVLDINYMLLAGVPVPTSKGLGQHN